MSKRAKQLLKLACNNVISTNATNSKPSCCRNLTTLFQNHKSSKHEKYDDQSSDYVRQWVNESEPSYGKQIGDITLDNTNYVIEIANDDYSILDNANYVNEISNDLTILENINYEAALPIEQNNVDEFGQRIIFGTPQLLEGSEQMPFYDHNSLENNINDEVVLPIEQNNDDVFEESVIVGKPSQLSAESDQIQVTNSNKRKARVSIKGDTRKFRKSQNENKNKGMEYINYKKKPIKARKSEPLGNCRNNCKSKVEDNLRYQLFEFYWSMGNYNRRAAYISKLIVCSDKISSRKRRDTPEKQKPKEKTYKYYIPKNGNLIIVCKLCFMKIFGETRSFLRNVCTNMLSSPAHRCSPDKRGGNTPGNKRSNDDIKILTDHLNKLPSYESHYCRKETSKKYLPSHYTLKLAYDMYTKSVENPVCMTIYAQYFKNSGLKVKNPKNDTCAKCDKYKIQLLTDNNNSCEQTINKLIDEKKKHQDEAEFAYQSKRNDISEMSTDKCVLSFDLQQCLPTPSLESSVAFYKRQLWTYNLTVHNCTTSQASCYIWYESIAKRGANEIGSCIFHYLSNLPKNITNVIMYSDCCPGQNRNGIMIAMCLYFLNQQDTIKIIDHKFMVPGHTRMECDGDHGKIEKAKKTFSSSINHPQDWINLIQFAGKNKFSVIPMSQDKFFNFNSLFKNKVYQMKKKNEDKDAFVFQDLKWLRYTNENKGIVQYKTSLDPKAPFFKLNLSKNKAVPLDIPLAYTNPLGITEEKKKDLMSLLAFIPEVYHEFYKNLRTKKNMTDPLASEEEEDE